MRFGWAIVGLALSGCGGDAFTTSPDEATSDGGDLGVDAAGDPSPEASVGLGAGDSSSAPDVHLALEATVADATPLDDAGRDAQAPKDAASPHDAAVAHDASSESGPVDAGPDVSALRMMCAAQCSGCCDLAGLCWPGTTDLYCGSAGNTCLDCAGTHCNGSYCAP